MITFVLVAGYGIWTLAVVLYYTYRNFWTFIRYSLGVSLAIIFGPESLHIGFSPDATLAQQIASIIVLHISGSILCPAIFGWTIVPVMVFLAFKRNY